MKRTGRDAEPDSGLFEPLANRCAGRLVHLCRTRLPGIHAVWSSCIADIDRATSENRRTAEMNVRTALLRTADRELHTEACLQGTMASTEHGNPTRLARRAAPYSHRDSATVQCALLVKLAVFFQPPSGHLLCLFLRADALFATLRQALRRPETERRTVDSWPCAQCSDAKRQRADVTLPWRCR